MISKDEAIEMAMDVESFKSTRFDAWWLTDPQLHALVNAAYAKGLEDAAVFAVGDLIGERHSQVGERIAHGIRLMKEKK